MKSLQLLAFVGLCAAAASAMVHENREARFANWEPAFRMCDGKKALTEAVEKRELSLSSRAPFSYYEDQGCAGKALAEAVEKRDASLFSRVPHYQVFDDTTLVSPEEKRGASLSNEDRQLCMNFLRPYPNLDLGTMFESVCQHIVEQVALACARKGTENTLPDEEKSSSID